MFFYEAEGFITNEEWSEENNDRRVLKARARNISIKSDSFNKRFQNEAFFFVSAVKKFYGHPVQYMIQTDDEYMQKDMSRLLLQALYDNGVRTNKKLFAGFDRETDYLAPELQGMFAVLRSL